MGEPNFRITSKRKDSLFTDFMEFRIGPTHISSELGLRRSAKSDGVLSVDQS